MFSMDISDLFKDAHEGEKKTKNKKNILSIYLNYTHVQSYKDLHYTNNF